MTHLVEQRQVSVLIQNLPRQKFYICKRSAQYSGNGVGARVSLHEIAIRPHCLRCLCKLSAAPISPW